MKRDDDLEVRLENWAKVQRMGQPGGRPIGSAEGRYQGATLRSRNLEFTMVNEGDAEIVERAWCRLMPFDKDVLRMHYILRMDPRIICRKIRIPHRPANTFLMALTHAKQQIAKVLSEIEAVQRVQFERQRTYDRLTQRHSA
ncbi:hypothetical protein [Paraburkholderia sacchari]|uniref:hypothetical protein n=1 Tax=Paraburkholderia sacchari TaxID=159450 RepID=UPI001BD07608|nr:hypothetical protein [Paraburkholderia sacchari]